MVTLPDLIDKLPSGDDLIKGAIQLVRRHKPEYASRRNRPLELWSRVSKLTGYGSGYSTAICVKYGFDPSETWITDSTPTERGKPQREMVSAVGKKVVSRR